MSRNQGTNSTDRVIALTLRCGAYTSLAMLLLATVLEAAGESHALLAAKAGVMVLLLTPLLRILVTLVAFFRERDWRYVLISAGVLAIVLWASLAGVVG